MVGAVTVHGTIGVHGVIMLGVFASEFPTLQGPAGEVPVISLSGQVVGAVVFALLGFIPAMRVRLFSSRWVCYERLMRLKFWAWIQRKCRRRAIQKA